MGFGVTLLRGDIMTHRSRFLAAAALASVFSIAAAAKAQTSAAPSAAPICTVTKLQSGTNAEAVKLCNSPASLAALQSNDPLSFYYGYVEATSLAGSVDATNKRSLGRFLAGIFSTEKFTAQISVVLEIQTSSGSITLPEQPLMIIQRKSDSEVEVSHLAAAFNQTRITPYFALDDGDPQVTARFRVRRVNKVDLQVADVAQAATGFAGSLGAEGWLVTNLASGPLLDAITKAQAYAGRYFSDDVSVSVSAPLSFNKPSRVTFETGWSGATPSTFNIALQLGVRQSLVTSRTRVVNASLSVPDVISAEYAPAGGTWANGIVIQPGSAGITAKRLDSVLTTSGVPRRLKDLETPAAGSNEPAADRVGAACHDLADALSSDQYFRLNRTDSALVLYDQLVRAGVFSRYPAGQVPCVQNYASLWKTRFGLSVASVGDREVEYAEMEPRLKSLGRSWKKATVPERIAVGESFVSPVQVELPMTLYPEISPLLTEEVPGVGIGQINANALASRSLSCFGEYRRVPRASATAYARFQGSDEPYVFTMEFVARPGLGVLLRSLKIRLMTAAEITANAQAGCVASPS